MGGGGEKDERKKEPGWGDGGTDRRITVWRFEGRRLIFNFMSADGGRGSATVFLLSRKQSEGLQLTQEAALRADMNPPSITRRVQAE